MNSLARADGIPRVLVSKDTGDRMLLDKTNGVPECPERLTPARHAQFDREGYIAFEGVLSPEEVSEALDAFRFLVKEAIEGVHNGTYVLKEAAPGAVLNFSGSRLEKVGTPFFVHFEPDVDPLSLDPEGAEFKVRKLHAFHQEHPAFQSLVEHSRVQGFVSNLLGHKALLFGDMALAKPPLIGSAKPWHQDNAYFDYLPLESIITAWVALDDATEVNGCMYVMPGEHKRAL